MRRRRNAFQTLTEQTMANLRERGGEGRHEGGGRKGQRKRGVVAGGKRRGKEGTGTEGGMEIKQWSGRTRWGQRLSEAKGGVHDSLFCVVF